MFLHEKSLAKGPRDKAEMKTLKSCTLLLLSLIQFIPVSSLARSMGATCHGGTVQSRAEIHIYECVKMPTETLQFCSLNFCRADNNTKEKGRN